MNKNLNKIKSLALAFALVLGVAGTSSVIALNHTTVDNEVIAETATTRTPSGFGALSRFFEENPDAVLKYGDSNLGVQGLNGYLFDCESIDFTDEEFNSYTIKTCTAVINLQQKIGRPVTGVFTKADWYALADYWYNN